MANKSLPIKNLLFKSGMHPHADFFSKGLHVAILRYHSVTDSQENDYVSPNIAIPIDAFEVQIRYFSKKYNIISMDKVAECYYNRQAFPKRAVVITFDDGYRDNYTAYQILKKYGVSGTFYVVAACVDRRETLWLFEVINLIKNTTRSFVTLDIPNHSAKLPIRNEKEKSITIRTITTLIKSNDRVFREALRKQLRDQLSDVVGLGKRAAQIMLTWEQLQEMSRDGMIIGGHTMTHLNLPNADPEDARKEIIHCKKLIEEKIKCPVSHFSYPNGGKYEYYNQNISEMVTSAGYTTATTSNNGLAKISQHMMELSRIRVTPKLPEIYYQIEWEPLVDRWSTIVKKN